MSTVLGLYSQWLGDMERAETVAAQEPWDSLGGGDSDRMWSHI